MKKAANNKEKYYIIPTTNEIVELTASSPEEALAAFALDICNNAGRYFRAATEDEYIAYVYNTLANASEAFIKDFYKKELSGNFSEEIPEGEIDACADAAYELYCRGDGHTEYQALEQAVDEFQEKKGGQ